VDGALVGAGSVWPKSGTPAYKYSKHTKHAHESKSICTMVYLIERERERERERG